ncbi:transposable element Tc3 transposase [Trichonephila clavipes]|uniref:Transposable element Tc3 transposase n=1 Tax=Trichonephila clavipes TaxID=2585209 RepID=A0A8X6UZK4_TRICX|nr:transposable element Tc3 transposase [Trichonephila clavipes]
MVDFHKRILFSDEAHFWLNDYVNKQNCRIWSEANTQVYVETPLHPEKLTVWCALWAGGIIGPYFFKNDEGHNVTVNGDRYRAMITNFFIPELNNHDVQELWFQQDGATCHTARATIDLLKDTFGDRLISRFGPVNWPPRSCDLTPLDYFLWGYVKSLVYADKPQTLDHLEDNIRRVIADIRPQMLEKVIENWTSRLDYIRASCGSHIPEIIFKITIKEIIEEISPLKCAYYNLPDDTDLKDALDVTIDLEAETQELEENVNLGDSRSIASKRLDQLWRRLDRDFKLNNLYTKFIEEYLSLDHMEEITNIDDIASEEGFFLQHHGVRAGNRSRGVIQDDLFSIMLRARKHAYFFSCDMSHMFRQIEIHSHQRHFQKILWKKGLNEPVQIFKLKTVTYGTTPACYLSTRVLKQLSLDERENFPKAADVILHDVYLDGILSGCSSLNELESLKTELTQLFKSAGMSLHKWCFSHSTNNFPDIHFDQSCEESITKTLGVLWNSSSDTFCFKVLLRLIISLRREMCSPRSHVFSTHLVS